MKNAKFLLEKCQMCIRKMVQTYTENVEWKPKEERKPQKIKKMNKKLNKIKKKMKKNENYN